MKCVELTNEKLNIVNKKLFKQIKQHFDYDLVIFVAKGAFLTGKAMSKYNNVPMIEIVAKRTRNKIKKIFSPILKKLPRKIKKLLRKLEIKMGIHEKNSTRKILFEEKNWKKYLNKKNILIVDDSADTGNTLKYVKEEVSKKFENSQIKIAVLNYFDQAKKNIDIDFSIYQNTILIGPWSNDSIDNKKFLQEYYKWKPRYLEKDKITVIIPVYNTESYLKRCIESIINQTYKNLEIILIDDGSTDKSGKICDFYAKYDSRIIVIHQKNQGMSSARNIGLKKSSGKYITFVDSDDFINQNTISNLYKILIETSSDISCCSLLKFTKQKKIKLKSRRKQKIWNNIDAVKELLYQRMISNSSCAKLYKRELFKNIKYPNGKCFEDLATTYRILLKAKKIVTTNQTYYYYYQRHNSIMHEVNDKTIQDLIYVIKKINKDLINYKELEKAILARTVNANFYIYKNTNNEKIKNESKKFIKKYRKVVLKDKNISKKTFFGLIISYFGLRIVNLLYFLKNIVK